MRFSGSAAARLRNDGEVERSKGGKKQVTPVVEKGGKGDLGLVLPRRRLERELSFAPIRLAGNRESE